MRKELTGREKKIFCTAAGVIIFSLVFNLFVDPLLKGHSAVNKEIEVLELKFQRYLWLLSKREGLELPLSERAVSNPLNEVRALAEQAGISIVEIREQDWKTRKPHRERLIILKAQGGLDRFMRFIYDLNNAEFMLRIKKAEFMAKPEGLEAGFSIAEISL